MFPEVSKNDFSTELFEELEIAEKNLNSNYEHPDNFNNFIKVAEEVKDKLKNKYGDQWTDPMDGAPTTPNQEDDEWKSNLKIGVWNYLRQMWVIHRKD